MVFTNFLTATRRIFIALACVTLMMTSVIGSVWAGEANSQISTDSMDSLPQIRNESERVLKEGLRSAEKVQERASGSALNAVQSDANKDDFNRTPDNAGLNPLNRLKDLVQ